MDNCLAEAAARMEDWRRPGPERARVLGGVKPARASGRFCGVCACLNRSSSGQALLDGAEGHCERAALFSISRSGGLFELFRGARGLETTAPAAVPLASAPAFASVAETKDTVVALRTSGELSEQIASLVGESPESRAGPVSG